MFKKLLFGGALVCYCLILLISFFTKDKFFSEIILILTPYWLALNFLILIILGWKKAVLNFPGIFLIIATGFILTRFLSFTLSPADLLIKPASANLESENNLKIAFLNKLYSNNNYSELEAKIDSLNPDLIGLSELRSSDRYHIPALANYPFNLSINSRDNATIAFFSKYPAVLDKNADFEFILPALVEINGTRFHVFILHPVPPINDSWQQERDAELNSLAVYINSLSTQNVLLMGDFNLTPWTNSYQNLTQKLDNLKNAAQGQGLNFTWHNQFIQTQIDHIFVPTSTQVEEFNSEYTSGSDHNLIWAQISSSQ